MRVNKMRDVTKRKYLAFVAPSDENIKFLCFPMCVSELLSHSPKIIEFYLSIHILFKFYKQKCKLASL